VEQPATAGLGFLWRLAGSGGVGGVFGLFWSRPLGCVWIWASRADGWVLLRRRSGWPVILTPDDPTAMIRNLQQQSASPIRYSVAVPIRRPVPSLGRQPSQGETKVPPPDREHLSRLPATVHKAMPNAGVILESQGILVTASRINQTKRGLRAISCADNRSKFSGMVGSDFRFGRIRTGAGSGTSQPS
jgi:hypothetical protein